MVVYIQSCNFMLGYDSEKAGKLLGNQFGLRSWILGKSKAEKLKSIPDAI